MRSGMVATVSSHGCYQIEVSFYSLLCAREISIRPTEVIQQTSAALSLARAGGAVLVLGHTQVVVSEGRAVVGRRAPNGGVGTSESSRSHSSQGLVQNVR
jgi:hypothetical protein